MIEYLQCDVRGRVVLPKDIRESYGDRFVLVKAPREIVLLPASKQALEDLKRMGKEANLQRFSPARLRQMAQEQALEETTAKPKRR